MCQEWVAIKLKSVFIHSNSISITMSLNHFHVTQVQCDVKLPSKYQLFLLTNLCTWMLSFFLLMQQLKNFIYLGIKYNYKTVVWNQIQMLQFIFLVTDEIIIFLILIEVKTDTSTVIYVQGKTYMVLKNSSVNLISVLFLLNKWWQ